ncbi:MAG: cellulase family glycosylhydrolase [Saprospiraceae bacterium]|nr:cellulase family glycosylhydrolase [Lewinella sp.]
MPIASYGQSFVEVRGKHFYRDEQPYYFMGTNFWYGLYLAAEEAPGNRQRLLAELDQLAALNITNLRIMASGEGPDDAPWRVSPSLQPAPGEYNENLLKGLDFLLAEMGKRNMTAVLCLNNFWPWSGGFAQYENWFGGEAIPYPTPDGEGNWFSYVLYSARFYKNKAAMEAFDDHIRYLIGRTNTVTGQLYRDDPTIMSWQLANEPRGILRPRAYRRWIHRSAALIRDLDPNHLISIGSEGNTSAPTGNHFRKDHAFDLIDYTTIHIWIQNWGWYDPERAEETYPQALENAFDYFDRHLEKAEELGKPLVLEEFGIARDGNDYDPTAPSTQRDRYYDAMFAHIDQLAKAGTAVAGSNFWAWGGSGRPRVPKAIWQTGDDLIGDPPHEYQGWYSVYDKDQSTLDIIRKWAERMK